MVALILQSGTTESLQKKRVEQDYKIKRAPTRPQTKERDVENMIEIWHFCLFHVRNTISLAHTNLFVSVERNLQSMKKSHSSCMSWFIRSFNYTLSILFFLLLLFCHLICCKSSIYFLIFLVCLLFFSMILI